MGSLGTEQRPLRVAIIGSGPSGFYAAEALLRGPQKVTVDIFERLPAPFGLVRYGVAPDHPKIKNVIKVFEKTIERPEVTFLGNVTIGRELTVEELKKYYDAVLFTCGGEADREDDNPGINLRGSGKATDIV